MQITADTHDLKPPRPGRWLGPVGLALVAHALLMGALTWGVHWQQDEPLVSFEAELWSAVPREAAPRAVQPPPPPPPPPEPEKRPEPKPEPRPAPPPPPAVKEAEIATAQAKKKAEAEKREEAKKIEAKRKAELEKEKEAKKKAAEKLAQEKKAEERQEKLAEQKKQEQERKAAERREEQLAAKMRADQMARMMGQVGASGSPDARGSAARSSGPSSGYGNRVRERIRPNIRISQELPRNLLTEIEVRTSADGTISSRRVVKSSGNPAWDDAALRAIDRTGSLPRDTDGTVPSPMIVEMRPLD